MLLYISPHKKVTVWAVILFVNILFACAPAVNTEERLTYQQKIDSISSASIDSAYSQINRRCDTTQHVTIPKLVDSILKSDTLKAQIVADNQ